jgi:hypothetical protein
MPTVPRNSVNETRTTRPWLEIGTDFARPSDTDLMMALATMKELGRIPSFDERFRGQDASTLPIDARSKGKPVYGQVKNKAEPIPSDEGSVMIEPSWAKRGASVGVIGGSR